MIATAVVVIGCILAGLLLVGVVFSIYVFAVYSRFIDRIFVEMPLLVPDKVPPPTEFDSISFTTPRGRRLVGSLLPHTGDQRLGVVVFFHEYGADRWLALPYAGYLRSAGFDLWTFDFSSSGQSERVEGYEPLQWPTQFELEDADAAVRWLIGRPEYQSADLAFVGVSKGAGVALTLAPRVSRLKAIVTDGAFPIHGMVTHYAMQWVEIYSKNRFVYRLLPRWFYAGIVWGALRRVSRRRRVRYLAIEKAVRKITGPKLLMIHGKNDNYVKQEVIERLFQTIRTPKELWVVPKAKHNRCLEREEDRYRERVTSFLVNAFTGRSIKPADDDQPNSEKRAG